MAAIPSTPSGPGARVTLDANGKLPPLDGSQLTNLPGGGGATPLIEDQFVTGNLTNDTIAKLGWRTTGNGTGNGIASTTLAGHPGIITINPGGVTVAGRRSIQVGQTTVAGGFILSTTGLAGPIEVEWLIRLRGSIAAANLEMVQLGLVDPSDATTNGLVLNGICVQFNPTASNTFRASATVAGVQSVANGTTVVALDTWYRVALVYTDTGAPGGSLQLKVNGVNEGAPVTGLVFPVGSLGLFAKIDGQGSGVDAQLDLDRVRVYHTQQES